ncbi:hypothetical protein MASR2M18_10160 [Ignavibacteria bacterium]
MPYTYGAASSLMPPEQRGGGGLAALLQSAAPGISIPFGDNKGQIVPAEVITSNSLAQRIIDSLHLDKRSEFAKLSPEIRLRDVRKSIEVEMKRLSGVVYINCVVSTGWLPDEKEKQETAKLAADMTNTAVAGLDAMLREKNVSTARKTREFIERVIAVNSAERDSIYSEIERFQKENKIIGLEEQTKAIVESAVDIGSQLAKMQVELKVARQFYQPGSPVIQQYEQQLASLAQQYDKTQSGGLTSSDKFSIPLEKVPALTRRYLNLQRDLKIAEQVNAYLQTQKLQESIQEERDVPVVQVLDIARVPSERESPKRLIMIIVAFFVSAGVSVLWIIFMEAFRGNSLNTADIAEAKQNVNT